MIAGMSSPDKSLPDVETNEALEELVPLVPGQAEDESDVNLAVQPGDAFWASVASRDWTVETLVSQMRKGRINLSPSFQRRNAWLDNRQSRLIESILIGFPIPQLVLAENHDAPGTYFVLDGKQRLLSLRQFFADPAEPRDEGFEPLRLEQLEVFRGLRGQTLADLEAGSPQLVATLENFTIRTVVLSHWNSEDMLLSLFLRLNTGSLTLSPQELRQALIPGRFIEWLDATSGAMQPLLVLLGNQQPDRRMVDTELLLRFLAFGGAPLPYRGNLKQFLDDTCRAFNDSWPTDEATLTSAANELAAAIDTAKAVFGSSGSCRKWSRDRYERALNRAVFDVQCYSFAIPEVRAAAASRGDELKLAFQQLCDTSTAFNNAVTTTTKTPSAFKARHELWRDEVRRVLGVDYELPRTLTRN